MRPEKQDLTGFRFGRLVVKHRDVDKKSSHVYLICECDCGNIVSVRKQGLIRGSSKSCGCLRNELLFDRSRSENTFINKGDYTEMYDTNGNMTLIDTEDVERIKQTYWSCSDSYWISQRGKKKTKLHRFIMNAPFGFEVDHIHGNPSKDNRKSNLRVCTHKNNCLNHDVASNNTSGVTGVVFVKRTGKYSARLKYQGKVHYLGSYLSIEDAIKARKEAEIKYFGEFRRNNQ